MVGVVAVGAIPLAALLAQSNGEASFTVAETGRGYGSLQAAVDAIGDREGTIVIASGNWQDCAVQSEGVIHFRAAKAGTALLGGKACEGKAALVLRGRGATVEGLVLADISVPDGNGAGIRLEQGPLRVSQTWFRDSQQGILTANGVNSELVIDKSTFTRLGTCENSAGCAHSIYVGDYGSLTVTRSRFEQGTGGHYLKSRTARTVIEDCSFDDSNGRATNYLIDLPNGGTGAIRRNWFVQGRDKENWSTMIAIGAESANYSSDGLVIADNEARLAPGLSRNPAFVADWTGDSLVMDNNRLGTGIRAFETR
ncbi:right-handed parallel beta-helix repeat-containing protein [Qipengyuania sp. 6D47A]|uniref:Right-handed parallel beta-helix repeat-containing protein n=1 Tax=Qipengyuania qiaonensis TaxID=2867240 RepID=A0ABS7J3B5_9SPHN|nr:right-handed parallel beta-helix repeat-containing protein [Qipengyuania qiaonensis]